MHTTIDKLKQALDLQKAGRLSEASKLYAEILEVDARQPDALHLLGLIAHAQGDHHRAVELIQQAVDAVPNAVYLGNLGVALRHAGDIDGAIKAYLQAISLEPNHPDAHYNLGKALKLKGNYSAAEHHLRSSLSISPNKEPAWLALIALHVEQRDYSKAIETGEQAAQYCPSSADVQLNLGSAYRRASRADEAIACYRKAYALKPNSLEALCRLASILITKHELVEGQQLLQRAISLEPQSINVLNAKSLLYQTLGNTTAAVEVSRQATELFPTKATAFSNLSSALRKLGFLSEALLAIEKSIALESDEPESHVIKAGALMGLGRLDDAIECFRTALKIRPNYKDSHDGLLMCLQYQPGVTAKSLLEEHLYWNQSHATSLPELPRWSTSPAKERRLRIGFVSGDLGAHPVGYFTLNLFESLDPEEFWIAIYSDRIGRDAVAQRIETRANQWCDVAAFSDDRLLNKIRQDKIDILFDLAGHTAQNRLLVFARRAAPLQISWAGYVGTTGVRNVDVLLADRFHVPSTEEMHYSERVARMDHGYICYSPPLDSPDVSPLPALANGFITFCAMCNPAKVNERVLRAWSRILQRLPGSKLLLCYKGWRDQGNRERVCAVLAVDGCAERVDFLERSGPVEVMATYAQVDLALDTFPYSGGLTTCEAMWMGVPTITFPGSTFAGRHSYSHLSNVGLQDFIARDEEDYISKAVSSSDHLDNLANVRATLRARMTASPLCDAPRFASDFSRVIREIWEETVRDAHS